MHHIYLLPPSPRPPSFCHGSSLYLSPCKVSSWLTSSARPSASVIFLFFFFCCQGVFLPWRHWRWLLVHKLDLEKQIQGFLRQLVLNCNYFGRVSRSELGFSRASTSLFTFPQRSEPLHLRRWGAAMALDTGFPLKVLLIRLPVRRVTHTQISPSQYILLPNLSLAPTHKTFPN